MTSTAIPQNPTPHHVSSLLPKLQDADPDIRYMSLNDLSQILTVGHPNFLQNDYSTCARVVDGLLRTLGDQNGDVQNMAIKCLGPFVNRAPESILCPTFEKVSTLSTAKTVDSSVPALAVRAMVVALPRPVHGIARSQKVQEAYSAISRALIPRLVGRVVIPLPPGTAIKAPPTGMIHVELETGEDSNALDVLTEVARCFGPMLQEPEVEALQDITMQVLTSERCGTVMKKKAVTALSALAQYFSDTLLSSVVSRSIENLRQPHITSSQRKLYLTIYGSMARSIPRKFGPYLKTLSPFVLSPLSQEELDAQAEDMAESDEPRDPQIEEVREAALIALEAFMAFCSQDMLMYTKDTINAALRFLKYDPNCADDDDEMGGIEDEEDDEFEGDDDFEEETGFDDEDDVSWKVRRCSAKVLYTLTGLRGTVDLLQDGTLYDQVAPALVTRFKEREESVRLEVMATLAFLVRRTGEQTSTPTLRRGSSAAMSPPASRKRRRGSSDAGISDVQAQLSTTNGYASPTTPPPQTGPAVSLAKLNPDIVRGAAKLLKSSTLPSKQAAMSLLTDLVTAQHGGLADHAEEVVGPVLETMRSAHNTLGTSSVTANSLRTEALQLLRALADMHSSKILQPHLEKVIPALILASKDKFSKVSTEALSTIEVYIKALTPPRSAASKQQNGTYLQQLYETITDRISANDADTEVRRKAIQALGLLIGRTSGSQGASLLSQDTRQAGMQLIGDRLRNELTRLASVRAVDTIAVLAQSSKELQPEWVQSVSLDLGAQLRKISRPLRGASLSALRMIAVNNACRECLDEETIAQLVENLLPLLKDNDLHMLGPALVILGAFAKEKSELVLKPEVIDAFCVVVKTTLTGAALDALLSSVEIIGKNGAGGGLMRALLENVGVSGNPEIVGQVIGTLLVAGGASVGVDLSAFEQELNNTKDDKRKCLALYVLGEAGLRMGSAFPLDQQVFTSYFTAGSEKVPLAAAVALGRVAAGNVSKYLPQILSGMEQGKQYLLLHSVKELLQHSNAEADIIQYSKPLWNNIIEASQAEDNKVVGAECIGRLAIIDPSAYLPQLQVSAKHYCT